MVHASEYDLVVRKIPCGGRRGGLRSGRTAAHDEYYYYFSKTDTTPTTHVAYYNQNFFKP